MFDTCSPEGKATEYNSLCGFANMVGKKGQRILKRWLDVLISLIGLVLLAVPFALIAVAIRLESKGSVFFRQERVGKGGGTFRVWKFRTMIEGAVDQGLGVTVVHNDPRFTSVGRFLRGWGLDELLQFLNVLKGEMSLVGPRPTLPYQVEHYNDFQSRRLEIRPGITSLAVVSGRNDLPWEERIKLDIQYLERWSLWLDLWILLKTLWVVLVKREGLYGADGINDPFVRPPSTPSNGASSETKHA